MLNNRFIEIEFPYRTIQRLLVYSQSCSAITSISQGHFHHPRKEPHNHQHSVLYPPSWPLATTLSLKNYSVSIIRIFWIFHRRGIISIRDFCVWLLSPGIVFLRFIHVVAGIRTPFLDFPGGAVVKNPPANAGDTGSIPAPGRPHMLRSN